MMMSGFTCILGVIFLCKIQRTIIKNIWHKLPIGKVFHAPDGQACPIYECVVNQKDMKGCGECEHIPCEIWRKTKDPAFTEEEFERNIQERVDRLKKG